MAARSSDPITTLAGATMRAFADAAAIATADSPLAEARERLGKEGTLDVAVVAMREGLKRLLIEEKDDVLAELAGPIGGVAAQARVLGIVEETIAAIVEAARQVAAGEPVGLGTEWDGGPAAKAASVGFAIPARRSS